MPGTPLEELRDACEQPDIPVGRLGTARGVRRRGRVPVLGARVLRHAASTCWSTAALARGIWCLGLELSTTRIARASWPPSDVHLAAEAREQRPVERLALDDLEALARRDAALGQVAQHLGIGVGDAHEDAARRPAPATRGCSVSSSAISSSRLGIGSPCGSWVGLPSFAAISSSSSSERTCSSTSASSCTRSQGTPERLGQVQLQQPVVAQDLERDARGRCRSASRPGRARA